jgi:hypothetical protein
MCIVHIPPLADPHTHYMLGIIDILQHYNARKKMETFFKGITAKKTQISCVDPKSYVVV